MSRGIKKELSIKTKKIIEIRKRLGLTVSKLAIRCGYSVSAITLIEMGEYEAAEDLCRKISIIFGVDYEWLMDDEDLDNTKMFYETSGYKQYDAGERGGEKSGQGKRVRRVYEESGLPQREFCSRIGSSPSNLQAIMSGKRPLSLRYAERIEKEYNVGADWLIYGIERSKDYPCTDGLQNSGRMTLLHTF